jgi:hypothetical protein
MAVSEQDPDHRQPVLRGHCPDLLWFRWSVHHHRQAAGLVSDDVCVGIGQPGRHTDNQHV